MRLSMLIGAGAFLAATAIAASAIDPQVGGVSDEPNDESPKHIIPIKEWKCTGDDLNGTEVQIVKEKGVEWGKWNKIPGRNVARWAYGNAALWICNCKLTWKHGIVKEELDEFEKIMEKRCGPHQSGWVVSKFLER
ncbi:hypothetical protein DL770_007334 [Monosporascus sp. CRB-9-2]|nr:hypothetical protein DL770_007334 [Monosporascus sp. CRB-9-2]